MTVREAVPPALRHFEATIYLVVLASLGAFYGLERAVFVAQDRPGGKDGESTTGRGVS